jgi:RNA polymerase sigma-70 factor, ECF subfamily
VDPVTRARDGDVDAFDELVHRHAPAAYRVAVAAVGETLAPDLVAEAFLAAWRHLPRLRDPDRFAPWLLRIVVNRGRSLLRRARSVREIPVTTPPDATVTVAGDGRVAAGTPSSLASAFSALAYDQRAIIALEHAAGLSQLEVGEALEVPATVAGSRLAAALESLGRRAGIDGERTPAGDERMPSLDPRLEAYLASLAEPPVPRDLPTSVAEGVRRHPGRQPSLRLPALSLAAGLLLVVAIAMAGGWKPPIDLLPGPQPTPTQPDPSRPALATFAPATPSPVATPTFRPPDAWTFARISAAGAEIREGPGSGRSLGRIGDREPGTIVLVLDHQRVDGQAWTKVEESVGGGERFVWLPETVRSSGRTGPEVAVLEPVNGLPCVTGEAPTFGSIAPLLPFQRLACYGGMSLSIGPVRVTPGSGDIAIDGTPAWLAGSQPSAVQALTGDGEILSVPVRVDPSRGLTLPVGRWIDVTVHLNDRSSSICTRTTVISALPVGDASDQVLWCRQQLVVTSYSEVPQASP